MNTQEVLDIQNALGEKGFSTTAATARAAGGDIVVEHESRRASGSRGDLLTAIEEARDDGHLWRLLAAKGLTRPE